MNRSILFLIIFFNLINLHAQKEIKKDSLETNWNLSGKFTFLGNQSSYSYWTAGGQTSVSGTIKIDYDFNYDKDGWKWDTKIITANGKNKINASKKIKKPNKKKQKNN